MDVFQYLQAKLFQLYKRPDGQPMTYAEQSTLSTVSRRPDCKAEFDEIAGYRAKNARFFPQTLSRLLDSWQECLDKARNWLPDASQLSGPMVMVLRDEKKDVEAQLDVLSQAHSGVQSWSQRDRDRREVLRKRLAELKNLLGVQV